MPIRNTFTSTEFYSDLDNENPGNVVNLNSVKQAIFNLLNTSKGERIFEPQIGVEIEDLLFEPGDPVFRAYAMSILNELVSQEPRIELDGIEIDLVEDANTAKMIMRIIVKRVGDDQGSAEVRIPIE